jgi:hypothetical protein
VKTPSSSLDWKGTWFLFVSITQLPKCLLLNVNGICIYGIQWSAVQFFVSEWIIWVVIIPRCAPRFPRVRAREFVRTYEIRLRSCVVSEDRHPAFFLFQCPSVWVSVQVIMPSLTRPSLSPALAKTTIRCRPDELSRDRSKSW